MIAIICGGVDHPVFGRGELGFLDILAEHYGIDQVYEGGAPGADTQARLWAHLKGIPVETFPADWNKYGSAAGPIRNNKMLRKAIRSGKGVLVIAFRGAADMVARTKANSDQVQLVTYP